MSYDSTDGTLEHIALVKRFLWKGIFDLGQRAEKHDASKLVSPEKEVFDEVTPLLKSLKFDSDEYKACLRHMGTALDHHYENNDHHPEHYQNNADTSDLEAAIEDVNQTQGNEFDSLLVMEILQSVVDSRKSKVRKMNLLSIFEMLCDWKAAGMRHGGDIRTSIDKCQKKFGFSDELKEILLNTTELFE